MDESTLQSIVIEGGDTVLIVDDDDNARDTLVDILETMGQRCIAASGAAEAIEMLAECCVDLVVTDMHMPGQSGLDLLEHVRRTDETIPVIMITGYPTIDAAVNAMKRGAVEFLTKPYNIGALSHTVSKALRERHLRQENQRLQAEANKTAVIEKLNRELNSKLDELTRLYRISEGLTQFMDAQSIFDQVVRLASEVTGAQRVSLMLLDRTRSYMAIRASVGIPRQIVADARVAPGVGIAGKVVANGRPIRVIHVSDPNDSSDAAQEDFYASRSWLSHPLHIGEQIFGVLNLTDKPDRSNFTPKDEHIMSILLEKASTRLENLALYEGIYANLLDTLNSLVTTIEAKDPYTRQHSQRVTDYALKICEVMDIGEDEREMIEFAGLLHDIGKIGVHDEILTKAGRLTDEEYDAIKQHPLIGEKIVEPLGLTPVERAIIRNHHERIDGRGYPDGLAGDEIPFLARLLAVADSFDAMTTTRSYRRALGVPDAIAELKAHRGTQFDPEVVDAMLDAIERGWIEVPPAESAEAA